MGSNLFAYQDMKIIIERNNLFSVKVHAILPSMSPDKVRFITNTEVGLMIDEIDVGQIPPKALLEMPSDVFNVFIQALSIAADESGIKIERESKLKGVLEAKEEELRIRRQDSKEILNLIHSLIKERL